MIDRAVAKSHQSICHSNRLHPKDGKKYTRNNLDAIKNNSETTMLISFKFKRGEYTDRIKVCVKDSLQLIPSSLDGT